MPTSLFSSLTTLDVATFLTFAVGALFGYVVPKLYRLFAASKDIYALDHALLNLQLPPTLWMNMGFWDSTTTSLPDAAQNLLLHLLQHANVPRNSRILDLGFGCGDQSIELQRSFSYTGLTINPVQFAAAQRRLLAADIFCGDAAKPNTWPEELRERAEHTDWVVALDCMYHFKPSREGIVRVAGRDLRAGLAAFDLFRKEDVTPWEALVLRAVCWMAGIPWANMCTVEEYRRMLELAGGYEDVDIHDISPNVFPGLAAFIRKQDKELKDIGVRDGVGRYAGAGMLFAWLGRTGLMRACLVAARRRR